MSGLGLVRGDDQGVVIDALAERLGGRVRVEDLLGGLSRRARRTWAPGLAVRAAWTWERSDRRDEEWWPQGISVREVAGRRLAAVTWYSKAGHGSRVTLLDLDSRRYEHVLLVRADAEGGRAPVRVHAGGLLWSGPWLHVAATARGMVSFRLDDLMRDGDRYCLPLRTTYTATSEAGVEPLRYSFLGLDGDGRCLTVGEYGGEGATHRLVRWPLGDDLLPLAGPDGVVRPVSVEEGTVSMQGAAYVDGRWHLSLSHGRKRPGTLVTGGPAGWRRHRWALPIGPEDLARTTSPDRLWTVTEYPPHRWVVALRRPAG